MQVSSLMTVQQADNKVCLSDGPLPEPVAELQGGRRHIKLLSMYVTRRHRFLCFLVLIPLALMITAFVYGAISKPRDAAPLIITSIVLMCVAACPLTPLLMYWFSGASRKRYQRDFLKDTLQIHVVAELGGVQWTLLTFPDRLACPAVAAVTLFLQNAHDTPRVVTAGLLANPFQRGGGKSIRQRLEGGEVGVLRFVLYVPPTAPAARHVIPVSVEVRREGRVGARVIRQDGLHPRRVFNSRRAELEVLGAHKGATVNEPVLRWPPFQRIYITGQAEPDLEPVRLLESL